MMLVFLLSVPIFVAVSGIRTGREEIVFPSIETLRSGEKRLSLRALNEDIELKLESAGDVFGEGFSVESVHDGRSTLPKLNIHDIKRNLYKDKRTGASLHIEEKEHTLINGIINHKLRIEPHESGARIGGEGVRPHRIYEIVEDEGPHENDAVFPSNFHANINESLDDLRSGDPIYVELLIVIDVAFAKSFSSDSAIILYLAVLINGAQCRFDNLKTIRLILVLCGVKIVRSTTDEPYIQNNIDGGYLLSYEALYGFGKHMAKSGCKCDIIVLLTVLDLCEKNDGKYMTGIGGLAFMATCCDKESEPYMTYRVGIAEDDGHCFIGIRTLVHEICHILGCPHDGDGPVSYLPGHPGSADCPWNDGFIMSYVRIDINQYYFSLCCEKNIYHLAKHLSCLRENNTGYEIKLINRLPGVELESLFGHSALNYKNDKVAYYDYRCEKLRHSSRLRSYLYPDGTCEFACRTVDVNERNQFTYWIHSCMDGEMCDIGKRCYSGICK